MDATADAPPLDFYRSLAANVARENGPHALDARLLLHLLRLHRHLTAEADGPDGALAGGLAAALLPAIRAACSRIFLAPQSGGVDNAGAMRP